MRALYLILNGDPNFPKMEKMIPPYFKKNIIIYILYDKVILQSSIIKSNFVLLES